MTRWDVVVVGAGFAGLACAEAAARRGLRTLVVDRKRDLRAGIHTTGLLTRESLGALRPPPRVLGERLDAIAACARSGPALRWRRDGAGFTSTDTGELVAVLAERAQDAGATLRLGARAEWTGESLLVGAETLRAEHVVACDGARSRIARAAGIAPPARLLAGAEAHVDLAPGHALREDECLLLLDRAMAPGYAAWCVRGVHGAWQCGVLGAGRAWRADAALRELLEWLRVRRGAVVRRVVETRGGVVPAGGAVARPWSRRFTSGRVIAAGDAAGHVSALTAGGIGRAAIAGRAIGESLGLEGDPWKAELAALARSCGGWRLGAAHALCVATALGAGAVLPAFGLPGLRGLTAELAFRPDDGLIRFSIGRSVPASRRSTPSPRRPPGA